MYKVSKKQALVPNIILLSIEAPEIVRKLQAGHFVILRVDETGERFPMSVAGWDLEKGTFDMVFYILGTSTRKLALLNEGDTVKDVVGPLGKAAEIEHYGTVICACGCFGCGPTLPLIKALKTKGNQVIAVMEARDRSFLFWEEKIREVSDDFYTVTGHANYGYSGWTDNFIGQYLKDGNKVDKIFIHGCPFMMMQCANASRPFGVATTVSLTPIMVDGTGMCGACRVSIGGETKYACVDGPDFNGHEVDWNILISRQCSYLAEEAYSVDLWDRSNWHRLAKL
jgi:ferredoxin/flavodoxin---NADP+ reductase